MKHVVAYAADKWDAENMVENLCAENSIILDYDSFLERSTECKGIATPADLAVQEVFGKPKMAIDIQWDVDCEKDRASLPTEIDIPWGMEDEEAISNFLSDVTGYCHKGYSIMEKDSNCHDFKIQPEFIEDKGTVSADFTTAADKSERKTGKPSLYKQITSANLRSSEFHTKMDAKIREYEKE